METLAFRSRQDINIAMVSQCADDLRRVCGMTHYRRGLAGGIELGGIGPDAAPVALAVLGMPAVQVFATFLPTRARWVSKVVHYCVEGTEIARWSGTLDRLIVLCCPERAPAAYPYWHKASA